MLGVNYIRCKNHINEAKDNRASENNSVKEGKRLSATYMNWEINLVLKQFIYSTKK